MGSFRSKEDDVSKILTSIFVTNFPDSFSAKDLFHSCKQYGHVSMVYWVRASKVLGWTPEFFEEEEEDELSVEDNNDGRINDLEANNGIDESDVEEVLETLFDQPDDAINEQTPRRLLYWFIYPFTNKEKYANCTRFTEEEHSLVSISGFHSEEGLYEDWRSLVRMLLEKMRMPNEVDHKRTEIPSTRFIRKSDMEQHDFLKRRLKRAVWDCGVDKSPGPMEDKLTFIERQTHTSKVRSVLLMAQDPKETKLPGKVEQGLNSEG
ncbi:hypothetical protein Tco_0864174 [Tanacetum coccineum]